MKTNDFASSMGLAADPNGNPADAERYADKFKETFNKCSLLAAEAGHRFLIQTLVSKGEDGKIYYGTCVPGGFPLEMFSVVLHGAVESIYDQANPNDGRPITTPIIHVMSVAQPADDSQDTPGLTPKPEPTK